MWTFPGPGLRDVSPALAGKFLTAGPLRKPPTFHLVFFGRKSLFTVLTYRIGRFISPPWGQNIYIHFLKFYTKDLSFLLHLLLYSIIYLFSYRLMDIYFILWFIIQYYFIFLIKLFQLWPLDSQWFLCSFDISPSLSAFFFFSTSSLIDTTKCSRLIVCNSCPGLKINHFSKEPFIFIGKSY